MGALVALISSYFGNNCESESAVFGLFFFTWMKEIRSCNIAKDDLSFRSELGLFPLDETIHVLPPCSYASDRSSRCLIKDTRLTPIYITNADSSQQLASPPSKLAYENEFVCLQVGFDAQLRGLDLPGGYQGDGCTSLLERLRKGKAEADARIELASEGERRCVFLTLHAVHRHSPCNDRSYIVLGYIICVVLRSLVASCLFVV